ncbi:hypothetical protein ABFW14_30605, partial [Mycolicibacterium fortuitum]
GLRVGRAPAPGAPAAGRDLRGDAAKWEALSLSTAGDDVTAAQSDPLGAVKCQHAIKARHSGRRPSPSDTPS